MLDWLWKKWKREPAYPSNSLGLLQVYGNGPEPLSNYPGPIWRYQVPLDVKLECHLLPVLDDPSFLTVPRKPPLRVHPPVFQVAGQLRAEKPEELPVDEWLSQGTLWWLKRLGTAQVTGLLAYLLLVGHQRLDRQRYPEIDQTLGFLLAEHRPVKPSPPVAPVTPVKEQPAPAQPPPRVRAWKKFPVQLTVGPARVQFLDRRDGNCCWRVGEREFWLPLYQEVPLSLLIEVEDWPGSQEDLSKQVRAAFSAHMKDLLPRLSRYPAANRRLRPLLKNLQAKN